jgi:hypothetical protein
MTQLLPSLGWALLFALLLQRWLPGSRRAVSVTLVLAAVWLLILLPVDGLSLGGLFGGLFGELSVSSMLLLAWRLLEKTTAMQPRSAAERWALFGLIALTGWLFYPLALGLGSLDPYAWGYGDLWLPLAVTLLALGAWLKGWYLLALVLVLPLIAWQLALLGSNNLWDYLLDPFVLLGSSFWWVARVFRPLPA